MNGTEETRSNLSNEEDFTLVRAAQSGDTEAFGRLVRKYQRRIYALAYQMSGNHSDADDLAQDAFVKAYRAIGSFRFHSSFYTWIYRIALNTALSSIRRERRERRVDVDPEELSKQPDPKPPGGDVGKGLDRPALNTAIQKALDDLSPRHRAVVVMHEMERIPHREIARIMKCSEGTVRSRLHYARRKLQEKLKGWI